MARLMITAFAGFALGVGATTLLQSHSLSTAGIAGMAMQQQETQNPGGTSSLPVEDFDDRSLEFPRQAQTPDGAR